MCQPPLMQMLSGRRPNSLADCCGCLNGAETKRISLSSPFATRLAVLEAKGLALQFSAPSTPVTKSTYLQGAIGPRTHDHENVLRLDLLPNLYGLQTKLASRKNLAVRFVMGRVLREFRKLMDKLLFTYHAQTVRELLACCRAWEPDVRILGNVRAADAAAALAYICLLYTSPSPRD